MRDMKPVTNAGPISLLFSVIYIYMALKFDHQNIDYWSHLAMNATDVNI